MLTSPVVRCLDQQVKAEVHFLTKSVFAPLVHSNPYVSKVYSMEKRVGEVLPALRKENYDYIIDLHKNTRSLLVKVGLWWVPARSFKKLTVQKWLLTHLKWNLLPDVHIVDRYLQAGEKLGLVNDTKGLDVFIPGSDNQLVLEKQRMGQLPLPGQYVALVIGAAHATKRLPQKKLVELIDKLNFPVVLLGGKTDIQTGESILQGTKAEKPVFNACGSFSLLQSAAIVRDAIAVITHDTGLMHIAAAFQKPVVSIWGNTVPAFGMDPYYQAGINRNYSFEVGGLACRPCSKIGYSTCPRKHFRCMNEQPLQQIAACVNEIWMAR